MQEMVGPANLVEEADHGSLVLRAKVNHVELQVVPAAVYAVLAGGVPVQLWAVFISSTKQSTAPFGISTEWKQTQERSEWKLLILQNET